MGSNIGGQYGQEVYAGMLNKGGAGQNQSEN